MYRQGTNPFAHPRESSYIFVCCLTVTSFVVCLSECSIYSIAKVRAHAIYMCKNTNCFDNQHILRSVLYHFKQKCTDLQFCTP